jgi:threonine synthase
LNSSFSSSIPTIAAPPELADRGMIRQGDRVALVNTAAAERYLPSIRNLVDGGL